MWQFLGFLLLVGFVGAYFKWILAVGAVLVGVWLVARWTENARATAARAERQRADLAARADEQHNWVMQGDDRGTYGSGTEAHERYVRERDGRSE